MIAVIDYEAGNLTSVELALKHLNADAVVTQNPDDVEKAERVIFPGVGAAKSCMDNLKRLGMDTALRGAIDSGKPVMAICVGMQLLFESSEENGGVECLGILPGQVKRFEFEESRHIKIPHMGWNEINPTRAHPVLEGMPEGAECYFVHSYHVANAKPEDVCVTTDYEGEVFTSAVGRDNLFATQFHPEKSGTVGLRMLENFLNWSL